MLRDYQAQLITAARQELKTHRTVMIQLPTGGGKTHIFASITTMAHARNNRVWIIVPRNELLDQASEHLSRHRVPHGIINANSNESRAYKVHIVSKDTLIRRYESIKNWPDLLIFDEAHLFLDRQIEIVSHLPAKSKVIGFTATPERLDGRGLSDLYQVLLQGPSVRDLAELNYLTDLKYFGIPISGLETIKTTGTEYNIEDLDDLFKKRAIYGSAISHYRSIADGKPALVFCRSVKIAAETAQRFCDAEYNFEHVEGKMNKRKRNMIFDGLRTGKIHGITSCELATYGLDIPRIEVIIMLRPTLSRTLYYQMIGRGLRPSEGKTECIILDHVANLHEHGHPFQDYEWKFNGHEKRKRSKKGVLPDTLKLCDKCFLYFIGDTCPHCGGKRDPKSRKKYKEIDGRLIEIQGPVPLAERDPEEKREYQDRIITAINNYREKETTGEIDPGAIGELLKIADELGRSVMWIYWKLSESWTDKKGIEHARRTVNTPLLHEIARQKQYKPGWVWMKTKEIRGKLAEKA